MKNSAESTYLKIVRTILQPILVLKFTIYSYLGNKISSKPQDRLFGFSSFRIVEQDLIEKRFTAKGLYRPSTTGVFREAVFLVSVKLLIKPSLIQSHQLFHTKLPAKN